MGAAHYEAHHVSFQHQLLAQAGGLAMSDGAEYFRPPHAVTCWCDDRNVYVELPTKGQPYIQRFPITEAGFHKALSALKDIHDKIGRNYVLYSQTDIKTAYQTKPKR